LDSAAPLWDQEADAQVACQKIVLMHGGSASVNHGAPVLKRKKEYGGNTNSFVHAVYSLCACACRKINHSVKRLDMTESWFFRKYAASLSLEKDF
jgi:hypothetical protein